MLMRFSFKWHSENMHFEAQKKTFGYSEEEGEGGGGKSLETTVHRFGHLLHHNGDASGAGRVSPNCKCKMRSFGARRRPITRQRNPFVELKYCAGKMHESDGTGGCTRAVFAFPSKSPCSRFSERNRYSRYVRRSLNDDFTRGRDTTDRQSLSIAPPLLSLVRVCVLLLIWYSLGFEFGMDGRLGNGLRRCMPAVLSLAWLFIYIFGLLWHIRKNLLRYICKQNKIKGRK